MASKNTNIIFLVDDEPIQNEMLKDYISERFNYEIKTYTSGEDAIKDLHLNPDVVVLDFHLNSHIPTAKNGVEVLKDIKALVPATQVIMLSGQDKLDVAVDSMKYGAYDYVIKGETAFSRTENILNNIKELRNLKASNNSYKTMTMVLTIAVIACCIISLVLYKKMEVSVYK
jgi:DNA-binding NtrC family response regulator